MVVRRDLHIQLIDPSSQGYRRLFTFGFDTPIAVTGPQKLANRWLKVFLTPKGSSPIRRDEGSTFPSLFRSNADLNGAEAEILEAIDDTSEQIKAADRLSDRPTNERLLNASLRQFVQVPPSGLEFWVELTNLAREQLLVLIPYAPG